MSIDRSPEFGDVFALAVISVNDLHSRRNFDGDGYGWSVCAECRQTWPCMTQQALRALIPDEELDGHSVKIGHARRIPTDALAEYVRGLEEEAR